MDKIRVVRRERYMRGTAEFDAVQGGSSISLLVAWDDGTVTVYATLTHADKCIRPLLTVE